MVFVRHPASGVWLAGIATRLTQKRPALVRTRHVSNPVKNSASYKSLPDRLHVLTKKSHDSFHNEQDVPLEKLRIFPPTISIDSFNTSIDSKQIRNDLGISETSFALCNMARFRGEKGLLTLVKAFEKLCMRNQNAELCLFGEHNTSSGNRIKHYIERSSFKQKIHLPGFRSDVLELLPAFDLFVLSSSREPFGRVILEAMAAGLPVIATKTEGPLEIIDEGTTGLFCDIGDDKKMAELIEKLMASDELRTRLVENAKSSVLPRFTFSQNIERLVDEYLELSGMRS